MASSNVGPLIDLLFEQFLFSLIQFIIITYNSYNHKHITKLLKRNSKLQKKIEIFKGELIMSIDITDGVTFTYGMHL